MKLDQSKMYKRDMIRSEEDILLDFQACLIEGMRKLGVNQAEFADRLGVSKARVSQMLSSDANPTIKQIGRCLAALEAAWSFDALETKSASPEFKPRLSRRSPSVELIAAGAFRQINSSHVWSVNTKVANQNKHRMREAA